MELDIVIESTGQRLSGGNHEKSALSAGAVYAGDYGQSGDDEDSWGIAGVGDLKERMP